MMGITPADLSSFSPAHFQQQDVLAAPPTSVEDALQQALPTANQTVTEMFELRQQIYANKQLFYPDLTAEGEVADGGGSGSGADADAALDTMRQIETSVLRGKDLLRTHLDAYNQLLDKKEALEHVGARMKLHLESAQAELNGAYQVLLAQQQQCQQGGTGSSNLPSRVLEEGLASLQTAMSNVAGVYNALSKEVQQGQEALRGQMQVHVRHLHQLSRVFHIVKNASVFYTCPICLAQDVEYFLNPCGHTFCKTCTDKIQRHCYMCRAEYAQIMRLYVN